MSVQEFALDGKVALVAGAANPIGQAVAVALAEAGADVAVATTQATGREEDAARACAEQIRSRQRKGFVYTLDVTKEADVATLVQRTVTELGSLDIVVNAHDLPFAKPFVDVSYAEWRRVLEVNLDGTFLVCRAAAGPMLARGKGRIVNVVSLLGERGMANGSAYCAAQAGVLNLTRALSLEWARDGITVNAVGAGWTDGMGLLVDDMLKQQLARYLPAKRLAQPYEVGEAVVYLASDTSGFVTGQVVWVDGGALSHV